MLAQGSAFKLLDALLEVGVDGATREHLLRKADISVRTFYKHLKELLKTGLVQEQGNRYYFPLDSEYAFRFKLWRDLDKLYDRDERVRNAVLTVRNDALASIGDKIMCLWLVGSAARGQMRNNSDLDFLVITRAEVEYEPKLGNFKIQWVTQRRSIFLEKISKGDEFAIAALKQGLLIHDDGVAQSIYNTPAGKPGVFFFKEKETTIRTFRRRFFDHLDFEEIEEASDVLASLAETSLRAMLQHLGERPQGKPSLKKLALLYFGERVSECFLLALFPSKEFEAEKGELIDIHRDVSDHYTNFLSRVEHLSYVSRSLLSGHPVEFARALRTVFSELFGEDTVSSNLRTDDEFFFSYGDSRIIIQWKTLSGTINPEHLRALHTSVTKWWHQGKEAFGLLVVNSLREVPLLERTFETEDYRIQKSAHELGVSVMTSSQLMRIYNSFHLIGLREDYAFDWIMLESVNRFYLQGLVEKELETASIGYPEQTSKEAVENVQVSNITIGPLKFEDDKEDETISFRFDFTFSLSFQVTIINLDPWRLALDSSDTPEIITEDITDRHFNSGQAALYRPGTSDARITNLRLRTLPYFEYTREYLYDLVLRAQEQ